MTKKDLTRKIAEEQLLPMKKAAAIVDSIFDDIADAVAVGDKVNIGGFGIFEAKTRAARIGRNPQTKEVVKIPAATVPGFKAAKAFKEKVNK